MAADESDTPGQDDAAGPAIFETNPRVVSETDETAPGPDIPESDWTIPFSEGTWLYDYFTDVLAEERDIVIVIDDYEGRRGTGKTVASLQLAQGMDQTAQGITHAKAALEPEAIRNAYTAAPLQSGLVLDEGEVGASNRQAMSATNQALREIMSMGRVEQKYVVINTPIKGFIDADLLKLADIWISMVRKGLGLVHHLKWEPYSETLHTPTKQWLRFDDIETGTDLREVYNQLTRDKKAKMRDEDGGGFIPMEDHREQLEQVRDDVRSETRNECIRDLFRHEEIQNTALSQRMVAEAFGVSQSHVSNIT